VARPYTTAGWPERQLNQLYTLQTVSEEVFPNMKKVFLILTLGRRPLKNWVIFANTTNQFILGLDFLRSYDASVYLGCQTLRLAEEEVSLWSPGVGPRPSSLVVANDPLIPAQCDDVVMIRLESSLGVENVLVEPSPLAHLPEGIYKARALVRDRREVPVRVLHAIRCDQKLMKGSS
jgi:hypothetical protein